jgi:hypothetical protein
MSKQDDDDDVEGQPEKEDYEVGYGKPPKHYQFQPGQSGNRAGSGKGTANELLEVLLREGLKRRQLRLNGKIVSISQLGVIAKQIVGLAMEGDSGAFEIMLKNMIQQVRQECQRKAPIQAAPYSDSREIDWVIIQLGSQPASHCDVCGKPLYDELESFIREQEQRGLEVPPVRFNGPPTDEERNRFKRYCEELEVAKLARASVQRPATSQSKEPKKRKAASALSDLLLKEAHTRYPIDEDGKPVRKTAWQIAVRRQFLKAMQKNRKAIRLMQKYEGEWQSLARVLSRESSLKLNEPATLEVSLDFEEPPPKMRCKECHRKWKASLERLIK